MMRSTPRTPHHTAQRGMSLMFALLALAALSLSAVAIVRSVDTGTLVLGNLGFKQDATANADQATKAAIDWLSAAADLTVDNTTDTAYYATAKDNVDPSGQRSSASSRVLIDWDNDSCAYASGTTSGICTLAAKAPTSGAKTRYVIFRLCSGTGSISAVGNSCAQPVNATAGNVPARGAIDYSKPEALKGASGAFYRIVVRAQGARNTTSFTETIVQF